MDDLISRQAAIDALYHVDEYNGRSVEVIKELPSAQPERKKGRWIECNLVPSRKGQIDGRLFICSVCDKGWIKHDRSMDGINFCPNCGADMRGDT